MPQEPKYINIIDGGIVHMIYRSMGTFLLIPRNFQDIKRCNLFKFTKEINEISFVESFFYHLADGCHVYIC